MCDVQVVAGHDRRWWQMRSPAVTQGRTSADVISRDRPASHRAPSRSRTRRGGSRARRRPRPRPPTARPQIAGRPTSTASAPSASAFTTSVPRRIPPSISTGTRPATAPTTSGSAVRPAGDPSSWRPPWFDTTMPSTPAGHRELGVLGRQDPFHQQRQSGGVLPDPRRCRPTRASRRTPVVEDGGPISSVKPCRVSRCRMPRTRDVHGEADRPVPGVHDPGEHRGRRPAGPRRRRAATISARRTPPPRPPARRSPWRTPTMIVPARGRGARRRPLAVGMRHGLVRPGRHQDRERDGRSEDRGRRVRSPEPRGAPAAGGVHRSNARRFSASVHSSPAPPA